MQDVFRGVVPFVAVAQERSYRRAAERLGVTAAAVSKAVLTLEREAGVVLFARTSRRVELTDEGRAFYERCRDAQGLVQAGRDVLSASRRRPTGTLKVSASLIVARAVLRAATEWRAMYPDVAVDLRASDRLVRFAGESVDVGVRVGSAGDDSVVVHELCATRWTTVASPGYLARRGTPRTTDDLERHDCLRFITPKGSPAPWTFATRGGEVTRYEVRGRIDVDHGELLLDGALAGAGVAQVLDFMAHEALAAGRLVEVLAASCAPGPPLLAVNPPGRRAVPRVRLFVEHLKTSFRPREARA